MVGFDQDAAATYDGIFGLPYKRKESGFVILPVPFEATTSYGRGTASGPAAVYQASMQVDLFEKELGNIHEAGIFMSRIPPRIIGMNEEARTYTDELIADIARITKSLPDPETAHKYLLVHDICTKLNQTVYRQTKRALNEGKIPILLGGDHSTPYGGIKAYAEKYPGMGILHFDAHADLREAFEYFTYSHASIFYNVVNDIHGIDKLVQVGIRQLGIEEDRMSRTNPKIETLHMHQIAKERNKGVPLASIAYETISKLPENVYVSFDIDALDVHYCPHTGTPVPGGFHLEEAYEFMRALSLHRNIVGFDLNEVSPGEDWKPGDTDTIDAVVGANVLYKLIGFTQASRKDL